MSTAANNNNVTASSHKTTFCRICEAQCGLNVEINDNRITAISPDEEHVVSEGYACIKGLTFNDFRDSPDRITQPLKRIDNEFVPISWEQAYTEIGLKIKQLRRDHGDDSTGLYLGNPISFSLLYPLFVTGFVQGLNTQKFFNTGTLDCNNKFVVSQAMYGAAMTLTYPDVDRNQFLMIIGGNPAISKMSFINLPHPMRRIKAIVERGGRVVHINPRRTESAIQAGEHIGIRPDTDVFFLFSFLHELLQSNSFDQTHISKHMNGFEQLQAAVADWPAERTEAITRISADTLKDLVKSYQQADGAALYLSTGVNQGTNGTLAFWALEVINAISGNLDRLGGVQMGEGIIDYGKVLAKNPSREVKSRIGDTPGFLEALPSALIADEILEPGDDKMRALFVVSGNPLLTATHSDRFGKALDELELLVCMDIVRNETANHAHYILPGTHFSERPDLPFMFGSLSGTTPKPWFQFTEALLTAPNQIPDELQQLSALARASGISLFGSKVFQAMVNLGGLLRKLPLVGNKLPPMNEFMLSLISLAGKQGSLAKLRKHPHGILRGTLKDNNYLGKRVITEDGKINLAPAELLNDAQSRLQSSFEHHQNHQGLKLITKRERFTHNSWSHNHEKYVSHKRFTNYIYINPQDAKDHQLNDGDVVHAKSKAGVVEVPVCIDENMMLGAVALPHGWGHKKADGLSIAKNSPGVNANILAADGIDNIEPLSGMAQFNGIDITLEKAHKGDGGI